MDNRLEIIKLDTAFSTSLGFFSSYLLLSIVFQVAVQYFGGIETGNQWTSFSHTQTAVLFGIASGIWILFLYCFVLRARIFLTKSRDFISWPLLLLALMIILSTFIKPTSYNPWFYFWSDLTHSFPFTGLIGILTAILVIGIWELRYNLKRPRGLALATVHLGAFVFLVGTGVTSAFGIQGVLNMHKSETASTFLPLIRGKLSDQPASLPASVKLIDFTTEYYPEEAELRVYQRNKGGYDHVQSLSKDRKAFHFIGASTIEVVNFYPEFSVDYKITEQMVGTAESVSAGLVTISKAHEQESGWIFASEHEDGYLQGNGTLVLLTRASLKEAKASLSSFQKEHSTSLPSQVLLIQAEESLGVLLSQGHGPKTFSLTKLPLNISLSDLKITLERLHPASLVETTYKTLTSSLKNPVMEIKVTTSNQGTRTYLLAANKPEPLPLGNDQFLLFEKTTLQPKFFKSLVEVHRQEVSSKPSVHVIAVNQPLSMGKFKIYQADFRREDPTFSGFSVTADPGREIVMVGFALMALGLLTYFVVISCPKGKTA